MTESLFPFRRLIAKCARWALCADGHIPPSPVPHGWHPPAPLKCVRCNGWFKA